MDISLLSRMACSLVECANYEEYIEALKEFVLETNCEEFYLCLCENWLGHALPATQAEPDYSTADACLIHGYTQRMLVPLSYYEENSAVTRIFMWIRCCRLCIGRWITCVASILCPCTSGSIALGIMPSAIPHFPCAVPCSIPGH